MANSTKQRRRFLKGQARKVKLGGYGGTVYAEIVNGKVRVRVASVPKRQEILGPDRLEVRQAALKVADAALAKVQGRPAPEPSKRKATPDERPVLTIRTIWETYLAGRAGLPADALAWGRYQLADHVVALTPAARKQIPTPDSLNNIVQAANRLHRGGVLAFDRELDEIEAADLDQHVLKALAAGRSAETLKADMGRLRTAVRHVRLKRKSLWAGREDPTEGMARIKGRDEPCREFTEQEAREVIVTLRRQNWRAHAAATLAYHFGRRIGAIGGRRAGLHVDALPLTSADFREGPSGRMEVCWRANAAKGDGYGSADVWLECPAEVEALIHRLREDYPNPEGPDYPLIWSPTDPSQAVSYEALGKALKKAWQTAFDTPKPRGLGWHGFVRTAVTTLADEMGTLAAAEYTGRSEQVVQDRYKVVRQSHLHELGRRLEKARRKYRTASKKTDSLPDEHAA